ncbi:MAG: hypothetical protein LBG68_04155 [Coriobacteriales bacterium]|jgi:hypothetical protein|nr:hypothetical protein [Coriobacteriales bacterium]
MGLLQQVIKDADASSGEEALVKESLNLLLELAESRATIFEQAIISDLATGKTIDSLTVPVTRIIKKRIEYRAITANTTTDVLDKVTSSIMEMVGDPSAKRIVDGIAGVANEILSAVIGVGAGQDRSQTGYVVAPIFPAIVRYDFAFWARGVSVQAIRKHTESALTCVVFESAVDITKLTLNDFLAIYMSVIGKALPTSDELTEKIKMLTEARELYMMISGGAGQQSLKATINASRGVAEDELGASDTSAAAALGVAGVSPGAANIQLVQPAEPSTAGLTGSKEDTKDSVPTVDLSHFEDLSEDEITLALNSAKTRMLRFES